MEGRLTRVAQHIAVGATIERHADKKIYRRADIA
jgi:hypothetical protein